MTTEQESHGGPRNRPSDEPRDVHLQAALRHADDADVRPPHHIAAAIQQAAHQAAHEAARQRIRQAAPLNPMPEATARSAGLPPKVSATARPSIGTALRRFWQSLAAPRPVWAGGAAALVVTALTLNLWVGEPLPPAVPADEPALTPQPQPAPAAGARATPEAAPAPSQSVAPAPPSPPAVTTAAAKAKVQRNPTPRSVADESPARTSTPTPPPLIRSPEVESSAPGLAAVPAPAPIPAPRPAPVAPMAANPAAMGAAAAPAQAAQPSPAPPQANAMARAATASPGATRSGESSLASRLQAQPMPPSLTLWLRAARQGAADPAWPLSASQRRVLLQLDMAARGHWQDLAQPAQAEVGDVREMSWRSPSGQLVSLRVDGAGVHWLEPDGRTWFAPLDLPTREALLREF